MILLMGSMAAHSQLWRRLLATGGMQLVDLQIRQPEVDKQLVVEM